MNEGIKFIIHEDLFIDLNTPQKDESAKLGVMEFHLLWGKIQKYLVNWELCDLKYVWPCRNIYLYLLTQHIVWVKQEIFKNHDTDNSGTMTSHEMRGAATQIGRAHV